MIPAWQLTLVDNGTRWLAGMAWITLQLCVLGREHASVACQQAVRPSVEVVHLDTGCSAKLVEHLHSARAVVRILRQAPCTACRPWCLRPSGTVGMHEATMLCHASCQIRLSALPADRDAQTFGHSGILEAAKAVVEDLQQTGVLGGLMKGQQVCRAAGSLTLHWCSTHFHSLCCPGNQKSAVLPVCSLPDPAQTHSQHAPWLVLRRMT